MPLISSDFPWCLCWIRCPVWILCVWLFLYEPDPCILLSLFSCLAESELDSINILGSTISKFCFCPFGDLFKKPLLSALPTYGIKMNSSPPLIGFFFFALDSCLFHFELMYWVSFLNSNNCALRAAGMCVHYKWELMNSACPGWSSCAVSWNVTVSKTNLAPLSSAFILFFWKSYTWRKKCKRDSVSVQDVLLGAHSQSASGGLILTLAVCKSST